MRALFLYSEIAIYFLKCCEELAKNNEVHVVKWPLNKAAPFKFNYSKSINIYKKNNYNRKELLQLIKNINPDIIICSGWMDKDYLKITKIYFKKIPTVLSCDTQWRGSLKQHLAIALSPFFLLNTFSHGWVAGDRQAEYLNKLGFNKNKIKDNFYSCDLDFYNTIYKKNVANKTNNFPKRFLFIGRYYDFKGITDLWDAFIDLQKEDPNDWELWCLGLGDIKPILHPKIKHFGFTQAEEIEPILAQCSVFILPSRFEPWGVVVHEIAAAGLALILSDSVGSKNYFLAESKNGFSFKSKDIKELKNTLKKIINLSPEKVLEMGNLSHQLAQNINKEKWINNLFEIYNDAY